MYTGPTTYRKDTIWEDWAPFSSVYKVDDLEVKVIFEGEMNGTTPRLELDRNKMTS